MGAGEQQCHPSVSSAAVGIVNVHSWGFFMGQKIIQRGADLVSCTEKPALEGAPVTIQLGL